MPFRSLSASRAEIAPDATIDEARLSIAAAGDALTDGDLDLAKKECERGLSEWQTQLQFSPSLVLMANRKIGGEILDAISLYSKVLGKRGEMFPEDFALLDFLHLQVNHAPELRKARLEIVKGQGLFAQSKFPAAQEAYDRGLAEWRKLLDDFPALVRSADKEFAKELAKVLSEYQKILDLRGTQLPEDFVLLDFLQAQGLGGAVMLAPWRQVCRRRCLSLSFSRRLPVVPAWTVWPIDLSCAAKTDFQSAGHQEVVQRVEAGAAAKGNAVRHFNSQG